MAEGFSIIPNWVIRESDLDAHELLTYLALLNRADKAGRTWPAISTIARESRTSESTVRRTLKKLIERGFVEVERRKNAAGDQSNLYTIRVFHTPLSARQGPPVTQTGPPIRETPEVETGSRHSEGAEPPKFCASHPGGTVNPCVGCKRAREAHEAWGQRRKLIAPRHDPSAFCDRPGHEEYPVTGSACERCARDALEVAS
mgnify:CR=1 FL=1